MEVSQECSDSSVATGIRTVTTGLQICLGKRATFLNNEIGPYCDNPLNAPVIRKVAILDGSLDLIKCLSAGVVGERSGMILVVVWCDESTVPR